jgi:general secretion pathway protein K
MPIRPSERQRGFVLVAVLWLVTLLALQISTFNMTVRDAGFLASNELAVARGEALAAAGVELAAARLSEPEGAGRWLADGRTREASFAGARLYITITDEAGRFDINELDGEVAESLLRPFAPSQQVLKQWVESLQGRPLLDASELGRVLGLPSSAVQALGRYLTVHGGDGKINAMVASRTALLMLPGAKAVEIDRALELRRRGGESASEVEAALGSVSQWLTSRAGPAYRVEVTVRGDSQPAIGRAEATILPAKHPAAPFRVLSWRYEPTVGEPERN